MKKLSFSVALFGLAVVIYLAMLCRFLYNARLGVDEDEQAVYSAALVDFGVRTVLIQAKTYSVDVGSTFPGGNWSEIRKNLPVSKATFDDFLARNRKSYSLTTAMKLDVKYYIIQEYELAAIRRTILAGPDGKGVPIEEMRRRYPGFSGLTQFSRVGFNGDRSEALVYIVFECGEYCAEGYYLRLEKHNGIWQAEDKWLIWIS